MLRMLANLELNSGTHVIPIQQTHRPTRPQSNHVRVIIFILVCLATLRGALGFKIVATPTMLPMSSLIFHTAILIHHLVPLII